MKRKDNCSKLLPDSAVAAAAHWCKSAVNNYKGNVRTAQEWQKFRTSHSASRGGTCSSPRYLRVQPPRHFRGLVQIG